MGAVQYGILEMMKKIDFGARTRRWSMCGVLHVIEMAFVVQAEIFISEIIEKEQYT